MAGRQGLGKLLVFISLLCLGLCQDNYYAYDNWDYYDSYMFEGEGVLSGDLHEYSERETFSIACNTTLDCFSEASVYSVCVSVNITGTVQYRCACDVEIGYSLINGNCSYKVETGELCTSDQSSCSDSNAECREDGTNSGQRRCLCKDGYLQVIDNSTYVCDEILHGDKDPTCITCEQNEGICYDDDGDEQKDGCLCLPSRSGVDCVDQNVEVICDVKTFVMTVCYKPHDSINFTTGAVMHVDGEADDPYCQGIKTESGSNCPSSFTYSLKLPLKEKQRDKCGTVKLNPSTDVVKYENKIIVHQDPDSVTLDDVVFKTFCSFQQFADKSFQALGVISINRNDRGQYKSPSLTMSVENLIGNKIPTGVSLRMGDKIRLRIKLENDGTYTAIRVMRCTASTKPTIPDPKALTIPLVINSCPYSRQKILTYKNAFTRVSKNEVRTGAIKVFKMGQGDSVHIHCAIKLCMFGSENECNPIKCKYPPNTKGYGRKRRDVEGDVIDSYRETRSTTEYHHSPMNPGGPVMDMMVSSELTIAEPEDDNEAVSEPAAGQAPYLLVALGIVVILVFLLALMAFVVFRRMTRRLRDASTLDDSDTSTISLDALLSTENAPVKGKEAANVSSSSSGVFSGSDSPSTDGLSGSDHMFVQPTSARDLMSC